jgi:rubrerythrin
LVDQRHPVPEASVIAHADDDPLGRVRSDHPRTTGKPSAARTAASWLRLLEPNQHHTAANGQADRNPSCDAVPSRWPHTWLTFTGNRIEVSRAVEQTPRQTRGGNPDLTQRPDVNSMRELDSTPWSRLDSTPWLRLEITLADAVLMAVEFELSAFQLYRDLAERLVPDVQGIALGLAAEKRGRHELLCVLVCDNALRQAFDGRVVIPPSIAQFSAYVDPIEIPNDAMDDSVLDYAESRERAGYVHYGYLAQVAPPGRLQEIFAYLRDEEKQHEVIVRSLWSVMFSVY